MFESKLAKYFDEFQKIVSTTDNNWSVKGFIDVHKTIYTISIDTKVISKIIELMIFPIIVRFADKEGYDIKLSVHQNHYPDITFIDKITGEKIALDIKSTYRISDTHVNGMTLGAFTGYFRQRESTKNITYPYSDYSKHLILGVIYTKSDLFNAELVLKKHNIKINKTISKKLSNYINSTSIDDYNELVESISTEDTTTLKADIDSCITDEKRSHSIDNLNQIQSVIRDFQFFVQEKWKIATDRPGSGNTANIGSTNKINELINGKGVFTKYPNGKDLFDDYWMYYLTKSMAKLIDLDKPSYTNLETYTNYKSK